jgi:predicted nucleotidyltransferase
VSTDRHAALIAPACEWARADDRVRALLLKGSLARGQADERSDVDLVIVTMPSGFASCGPIAAMWPTGSVAG